MSVGCVCSRERHFEPATCAWAGLCDVPFVPALKLLQRVQDKLASEELDIMTGRHMSKASAMMERSSPSSSTAAGGLGGAADRSTHNGAAAGTGMPEWENDAAPGRHEQSASAMADGGVTEDAGSDDAVQDDGDSDDDAATGGDVVVGEDEDGDDGQWDGDVQQSLLA